MSNEITRKIEFFLEVGATPSFLRYYDSIWKKRWFNYELIDLPGGKDYTDGALLEQPKFKSKYGTFVTQDPAGNVTTGIGFVAANITVADPEIDLGAELARIFKIDSEIMGLAFVTPQGFIAGWIDREDVPSI